VTLNMPSEADLITALRTLADDVQVAAIHHRLASDLSAAVPEFVRELNQASAFWSLTMYAHLSEVRTRLCRLYDQHRSALSLRTWLAAAAKLESLRQSSIASDLREVEATDPVVKKVVKLRNNVVAHTAATPIDRRALEQAFGLTFAESDLLVHRAVSLVNTYGQRLMRQSWSTQIVGHDDYLTVLRAIRFHGEAIEAKIQAEIDAANGA
jgi:AbiU2